MDYQLEPCKIDGISDARLNAFPFNTTNGKLVEYLCLDTLWHPASEEPKKVKNLLSETTYLQSSDGKMCATSKESSKGRWLS